MNYCEGWPNSGCDSEATNTVLGYDLCDKCARAFLEPTPSLESAIDRADDAHDALAEARAEVERLRARVTRLEKIEASQDLVIKDCQRRFDILYDAWRDAKSNQDVADAVSRALFDWNRAART